MEKRVTNAFYYDKAMNEQATVTEINEKTLSHEDRISN